MGSECGERGGGSLHTGGGWQKKIYHNADIAGDVTGL